MSFSQTGISNGQASPQGGDLRIAWSSTQPAGTVYQVYLDGQLVWHGTSLYCVVPYPATDANIDVDIGWVDAADELTDYASDLPARPWIDRATLSWCGGMWETPSGTPLVGFHVYQSTAAGAFYGYGEGGYGANGYGGVVPQTVSYSTPVATIDAYTQQVVTDGYGFGGYGYGGYGSASARYSWQSGSLAGGTWSFGVVAFDAAGNLSAAVETSVVIVAPPAEVPPNAEGLRLTYTYVKATRIATLNWLASAG